MEVGAAAVTIVLTNKRGMSKLANANCANQKVAYIPRNKAKHRTALSSHERQRQHRRYSLLNVN